MSDMKGLAPSDAQRIEDVFHPTLPDSPDSRPLDARRRLEDRLEEMRLRKELRELECDFEL